MTKDFFFTLKELSQLLDQRSIGTYISGFSARLSFTKEIYRQCILVLGQYELILASTIKKTKKKSGLVRILA